VPQSDGGKEYPAYSNKRKANWTVHSLCRNCLLKNVREGKIEERTEVTVRRGRRRKQLLDNFTEK